MGIQKQLGRVCLLVTVLVGPVRAAAADYPIDLASHPGGALTVTVPVGRLRVVLLNRIPGRKYLVSILRESVEPPVLSLPSGIQIAGGGALPPACAQLKVDVETLGAPADEAAVASTAAAVDDLLTSTTCVGPVRDAVATLLTKYQNVLRLPEYDLEAGQSLKITVQRLSATGAVEKTWVTTLTTGPRGEWLTTYGLTFYRLSEELFFAKPTGTEGEFSITKQRLDADNGVRFLPTVLFSWLPAKNAAGGLSISPAAGFGATADGFGVLGGVAVTYNRNLGVSAGVVVGRQRRLLGRYVQDQIIKENLSEDQLHRDVLKPAVYLSVTFRFGSSPFGSAEREPAKTAEEPAKGDKKSDRPESKSGSLKQAR